MWAVSAAFIQAALEGFREETDRDSYTSFHVDSAKTEEFLQISERCKILSVKFDPCCFSGLESDFIKLTDNLQFWKVNYTVEQYFNLF